MENNDSNDSDVIYKQQRGPRWENNDTERGHRKSHRRSAGSEPLHSRKRMRKS